MTSNQSLPHSKALVGEALDRVLAGESLDCQTLYALADIDDSEGQQALLDAAAEAMAIAAMEHRRRLEEQKRRAKMKL